MRNGIKLLYKSSYFLMRIKSSVDVKGKTSGTAISRSVASKWLKARLPIKQVGLKSAAGHLILAFY